MKMILSREDAVSILMRWKVGSTRISGTITSGSVVVKFIGYISEASEVGFKIRQVAEFGEELGEISVGLNIAREYESESREVSGTTVSALQIHFAGFITCAMFEYARDEPPKYQM